MEERRRTRGDRTEYVAARLREAIAKGEFSAGAPIRQAAVAEQLGTSRIPVREALLRLESEGLVVLRPNSGARVARLNFAECMEIYKIRERLEPLAIRESIGSLTDAHRVEIQRLAAELDDLTDDSDAFIDGDRRLHLACYAGLESSRLVDMIVSYWNTTQHYRRALLLTYTDADFAVVAAEHLLMVDAVITDNARAAEGLVRIAMERSHLRLARHRELFED